MREAFEKIQVYGMERGRLSPWRRIESSGSWSSSPRQGVRGTRWNQSVRLRTSVGSSFTLVWRISNRRSLNECQVDQVAVDIGDYLLVGRRPLLWNSWAMRTICTEPSASQTFV
jgi:hypothetical protein